MALETLDALVRAIQYGDDTVVERLLGQVQLNTVGGSGMTPLTAAAATGNLARVRKVLGGGADPSRPDGYAKTPLMYAAAVGASEAVAVLLAAGADIEAQDSEGSTALIYAARGHRYHALLRLLNAGANVAATNNLGFTPEHVARRRTITISRSSSRSRFGKYEWSLDLPVPPWNATLRALRSARFRRV